MEIAWRLPADCLLIAFLIMDFHYLEMVSVVRTRMQALTTAPSSSHRYGERRPRTQAGVRASLHLRALHRTLRLLDQGARGSRCRLHARVLGASQGGDSTGKGA